MAKEDSIFDIEAEKARLLQLDMNWASLAQEGRDADGIVSYWAEDAVIMPAGQPTLSGKSQIREYIEACLEIPDFAITWSTDRIELSADAMQAYMFSKNSVTFTNDEGAKVEIPGRAVTIWRKDPDGEWRCVVDIWNAEA